MLILTMAWAAPFWEAKEPASWSEEEIEEFLSNSPWARPAEAVAMGVQGKAMATRTFLATAAPVRGAEEEWRRRRVGKDLRENDPAWEEWKEFLARDADKFVVLAVAMPVQMARDGSSMAEMENRSLMRVGKKKVKMSGYFPPSRSDPFTRLIFPSAGIEGAKEITFELYVAGGGASFQEAIYLTKEMKWKGSLTF